MGRSFYTYDEAKRRLKRSKRSILNYINKGMLNRVIQDGQHLLDKEDVEALAVDLGSDRPALNRATFFRQQSRIEKLENEMRTVTHILEIRNDPMRPDPVQAKGFYTAACDSLTRAGIWGFDEVRLWAGQLEKMDEATLEAFCLAVNNHQGWTPFWRLCREMETHSILMAKKMETPKDFTDWTKLQGQLVNARKTLRGSIILLVEMGKGASTETLLNLLGDPAETVMRKLGS